MLLLELFEKHQPGYQDIQTDGSQLSFKDSRKTRLTLAQIRRLRKMNDIRKLEHAQEMTLVKQMYATPAADAGGGGL